MGLIKTASIAEILPDADIAEIHADPVHLDTNFQNSSLYNFVAPKLESATNVILSPIRAIGNGLKYMGVGAGGVAALAAGKKGVRAFKKHKSDQEYRTLLHKIYGEKIPVSQL